MQTRFSLISLRAAVIIAVSALTFGIQAQTSPPAADGIPATPADSANVSFKRIDANQDGRISRDEAARMPSLARQFDQLDTDHDGVLSADEFKAALAPAAPVSK